MSLTLQIQIVIFHPKHTFNNCIPPKIADVHIITPEMTKDYIHHPWQLEIMKAMGAKEKVQKEKKRK